MAPIPEEPTADPGTPTFGGGEFLTASFAFGGLIHTAGLDTVFVQIYMDPPPGAPGVSKDAPGSTKHVILGLVR